MLTYLETCATALGLALDQEAKTCALRMLQSVTLREEVAATTKPAAAARASTATTNGRASSDTGEPFSGGVGKGGGAMLGKNGAAKKGREGEGKEDRGGPTVSSAQDLYAAVTTTLSRALVHCKRFEVRYAAEAGRTTF